NAAPALNGTLSGPVTLTGASRVTVTTQATLGGAISGAGGFTKLGGGNLILSGDSAYTGGTTLRAGALTVRHPNALRAGVLTMSAGTLQTDQPGGLSVNSPVALRSANVSFGSAPLYTQPLTLAGEVTLTGNNTVALVVPVTITGAVGGTGALLRSGVSDLT